MQLVSDERIIEASRVSVLIYYVRVRPVHDTPFFLLRDKGDIGKPVRIRMETGAALCERTGVACRCARYKVVHYPVPTFVYCDYTIAPRIRENHRATALLK